MRAAAIVQKTARAHSLERETDISALIRLTTGRAE
jgi:hypothetical protein